MCWGSFCTCVYGTDNFFVLKLMGSPEKLSLLWKISHGPQCENRCSRSYCTFNFCLVFSLKAEANVVHMSLPLVSESTGQTCGSYKHTFGLRIHRLNLKRSRNPNSRSVGKVPVLCCVFYTKRSNTFYTDFVHCILTSTYKRKLLNQYFIF